MSKARSKTEEKVPQIQKLVTPMQQNIKYSKLRQQKLQIKDQLQIGQQRQLNQSQIAQQNETEKISTMVSKLISKNKINSKNAFNVPLVSIRQLTSFKQENDSSWSKISQTLENSSKIYGFRVDSVSDNINRMTSNMMRSILKQQQENKLEQSFDQLSKYKFQCQEESSVDQHLEQARLKSQQYFIQPRPDINRLKFRRMLDSGGVKGLILATIPIQSNLAISMIQQSYEQQQTSVLMKTNCKDWLAKMVSQFKFSQMMIMQQIRRSANQILSMGKNNCSIQIEIESQTFDDEIFDHLLQNVAQQVGLASIYSLEIVREDLKMSHSSSYVEKPTYCEQTIWEDSVIKWNGSKKQRNKPIPKDKHKGIKIDKQIRNRQKVTEHEISFSPFQQTERKQILHKARKYNQIKKSIQQIVQRNLIPSIPTNFKLQTIVNWQQNKQNFKEDPHYEQMGEGQLVKFEDYSNFAGKQQISQLRDNDNEKQAQMMSNIRQIKQQLQRIIELSQQTDLKMKFSDLYQQHQRMTNLVGVNEAIDFLSVLHLGNQNNYYYQQIDHSDFYISKQ